MVVQLLEAHLLRGKRDADVGGLVEDLAQRERGVAALVGVGDGIAVRGDRGRAEQLGIGRERARLQDGHGRDRLEDGAGLEQVGDALELHGALLDLASVGGVEQRKGCGGVDLAGGAVHEHGRAARGVKSLAARRQGVLDLALQLDVDGHDDVLPVDGVHFLVRAAGDELAGLAVFLFHVARRAGEHVVVLRLKAADAVIVFAVRVRIHADAARADHLAAYLGVGILAAAFGDIVDARGDGFGFATRRFGVGRLLVLRLLDALGGQLPDLVADARVGLALDDRIVRVAGGDLFQVVLRLAAEHLREDARGQIGVGHLGGVDVDSRRVDAGGEHHAVAVVYGAAARLEHDLGRALRLCLVGELGGLYDLQPHELAEEQRDDKAEQEQRRECALGIEERDEARGAAFRLSGLAAGRAASRAGRARIALGAGTALPRSAVTPGAICAAGVGAACVLA